MAQLAPGANAAAYPPLPPAVGAAPALTPHAIIQSCAVRLGGVAVVVERNWEHWAPAHTLPRQGSPKWHGETEAEFNSFLATNNHDVPEPSTMGGTANIFLVQYLSCAVGKRQPHYLY